MDELHHYLVYFEPPRDVSLKVEELNKIISKKYVNEYKSYMNGEWFSHIAVYYQSPMPEENNKERILEGVQKVAERTEPFKVTLGDFVLGSNSYIFVDFDKYSKDIFKNIFLDLRKEIEGLTGFNIKQKYLDKWDQFSDEEKSRVEETGRPYPYQAHISVVRLEQEEDKTKAIELIRDKSLKGYEFIADEIKVLDFINNDNSLIGKFSLRSNN